MKQEVKSWSDRTGFVSKIEGLSFNSDKFWKKCEITASASKGGGDFNIYINIGTQTHHHRFGLEDGKSKKMEYKVNGFCSISVTGQLSIHSPFTGAGGKITVKCDYDVDNKSNWMADVPDDTLVSQLTIPGTHDTCALIKGDWVECQRWTIPEQLQIGIRFLDIRCRHIENSFAIHHGSYYQEIVFGKVLDQCEAFLKKNPEECILMSVKKEYNTEKCTNSFVETFDAYVEKRKPENGESELLYLDNEIPRLGNARGKIVIFRRFSAPDDKVRGIDVSGWKDNKTFTINNKNVIKVQDSYTSHGDDKWKAINSLLNMAKDERDNVMFLNFTSASDPPRPSRKPNHIACDMNKRLTDYFTKNEKGRYGTVIMDFPDKDLIEQLILNNNLQQK